ncbi:MAG: NAD(P)/FAD-dependent oxidoreductase, partial [Gemmatimonadales bacterium]
EVRFGATVADYDGTAVRLTSGEVVPTNTLIWAAGVKAAGLAQQLGLATARQGRLVVTPSLQVPDRREIYVVGDAAYLALDGQPLPMVAPVALQMADSVARNIARAERGAPAEPFRYRDPGTLATIGRNAAVAHVYGLQLSGFIAWVMWLVVHIVQLIGFRNKLFVLLNWAWDYFFYERAARLISRA